MSTSSATPTPDWTAKDLVAINRAIASGSNTVKFADREVRYQSLSDLLKVRQIIRDYLNASTGITTRRQIRVHTDKGW